MISKSVEKLRTKIHRKISNIEYYTSLRNTDSILALAMLGLAVGGMYDWVHEKAFQILKALFKCKHSS